MSAEMNPEVSRMKQKITYGKQQKAFSLIELVYTIAIATIPIIAVTILLSGSSRSWKKIFDDANSAIRSDGLAVMASIQQIGRQANITNYTVYTIKNGVFTPAVPPTGKVTAEGQAVEFRYWKNVFDPNNPPNDVFDYSNTGDAYALYYLDGNTLKLDLGNVVDGIGAVSNKSRETKNLISTQIISKYIDSAKSAAPFNHNISGGNGSGCLNTNLTLKDEQNKSIEIRFATLLRSAWPR